MTQRLLILCLLGSVMLTFPYGCAENHDWVGQHPDGWTLTFRDEFDTPGIDTAKWQVLTRRDNHNKEVQYYLPQNASIVDGKLQVLTPLANLMTAKTTVPRVWRVGSSRPMAGSKRVHASRPPRASGRRSGCCHARPDGHTAARSTSWSTRGAGRNRSAAPITSPMTKVSMITSASGMRLGMRGVNPSDSLRVSTCMPSSGTPRELVFFVDDVEYYRV